MIRVGKSTNFAIELIFNKTIKHYFLNVEDHNQSAVKIQSRIRKTSSEKSWEKTECSFDEKLYILVNTRC